MDVNPKQRRRHSAEFKAQVLAACAQPEASVATVALSFKLNDNLVHQWRRGRGASAVPSATSTTVLPRSDSADTRQKWPSLLRLVSRQSPFRQAAKFLPPRQRQDDLLRVEIASGKHGQQASSGLGLAAQSEAVPRYAASIYASTVATFTEVSSLAGIASALNERGMLTPRGGTWHKTSVSNLLARFR